MGFNLLKKLQAINSRRRDIQPQLVIVLFYSLNNLWIFTINIELLHSSGLLVLLWCIQSPYGWWNFVRTSFRSCNNSPSSAALVTEFCANNRGGPSFFLHWILFERLGLHKKNLSYNNIYQLDFNIPWQYRQESLALEHQLSHAHVYETTQYRWQIHSLLGFESAMESTMSE